MVKEDEMTKEKKITFEQALAKLDEIVTQVEQGKVSLEQSIEKYAEGMELIKQCRSILAKAEKKIQVLSKGEGESLTPAGELEEPAEAEDED